MEHCWLWRMGMAPFSPSTSLTNGIPVPNNDLQNSTGYTGTVAVGGIPGDNLPSGVDISQDGKFAIFGDISDTAVVEVASLSTGKLTSTVAYKVGAGIDAGAIRLSPDQTLLYIANSESGQVTAAFFNKTTGKIAPGCTSSRLRGFNSIPWLGSVTTRDTTGTGTVLYVAEFGRDFIEVNHGPASQIGIVSVTSTGTSCTLGETGTSPIDLVFPGALSIGVYRPRPF